MSLIERHRNWICRMAETEFADLPDSQNSKSAADEDSQETRMSVSPETRSPRGKSGSENMQQSPLLCSTHNLASKDAAEWRPRRSGELDAALCGAAGARHFMAEKEAAREPHERQHANKMQKFSGSQAAVGLPRSGAQASHSAPALRASSEAGSEPVHRGPTAQDALLTKKEGVFLIHEALADCCFPDLCLEATATRRATIARISLPIKTDACPPALQVQRLSDGDDLALASAWCAQEGSLLQVSRKELSRLHALQGEPDFLRFCADVAALLPHL